MNTTAAIASVALALISLVFAMVSRQFDILVKIREDIATTKASISAIHDDRDEIRRRVTAIEQRIMK